MLEPRIITHPREWNMATTALPTAHILQSWEWGEFKAQYGWTPTRISFFERGTLCAAAQVLRRPLPRTPFGVLYVPKGPVFDNADSELFADVLAGLEQIARQQRAIFIKIDPDILKRENALSDAEQILYDRRWRASHEQIQFRNTVLLDLAATDEELLAAMKPKTRYNIRIAEKRGVRVELGTAEDLKIFYDMYTETSIRDHFLIRPFAYYRNAWGTFLDAGLAHLLLARFGNDAIAGLLLFVYNHHAWYFYGASRTMHRDTMPNYLLQWEAIRWAKAYGCTTYDFWGAPNTLNEHEPMYGVYRFKEGFGGKFTQHIGAYDFVVNPALYFLYAVVRPWYLARLRSRHVPGVE